mmetsp:Transcript_35705/g.72767  ORF Transcript_35705/g.72767 Transcript_35705/m.72767 type:complete len:295 (+) Transcript_35705:55-939(+)
MAYAEVDNSPASIKPLDGAILWSTNPANTMCPNFESTEEERLLIRRNLALARRLGIAPAETEDEATGLGLAKKNNTSNALHRRSRDLAEDDGSGSSEDGGGDTPEPRLNPGGTGDIWQAAREGNIPRMRFLLDVSRVPPGRTRWSGISPLHRACEEGQLEVARLLLSRVDDGVEVSGKTSWGWYTPMHLACARGHQEVALLLLNHGARWDVVDKAGRTPLELAILGGFPSVARRLDTEFTAVQTKRIRSEFARKQLEEKEAKEVNERNRERSKHGKQAVESELEAEIMAKMAIR